MSFNSTSKELIEQNINGLLSIHDSWLRISMDSVANITNGFAFKSSEFNNRKDGVPLIRIRDVLKGNTSTYYSGQIPEGYWVYPEDLIVGMDGDFNATIWCSEPALLNQRVCKIEVQEDKYNKRFFYHALPGYLSAINANTSSVTVKHLSSRTLQDTLLPLPPLAEQKIIAEKLDTLLAQVDSTKARLEQIPQILKRFRQAVLEEAVSGRLTENWRDASISEKSAEELLVTISKTRKKNLTSGADSLATESKRYLAKIDAHHFNIPDVILPVGWKWTTFLQSMEKVVDCHNKTAPYTEKGIYLIRTPDIRNGIISLKNTKYVNEDTYNFWSKRCPQEVVI